MVKEENVNVEVEPSFNDVLEAIKTIDLRLQQLERVLSIHKHDVSTGEAMIRFN